MTPQQTRVVDPINTNVVRGYRQAMFIATFLFPAVGVRQYGGQVIEFGKEAFRLYNSRRARGAATKRVRFGYEGKPYAVPHRSLEGQVAYEDLLDAARVPGIDLSRGAVNLTMRSLALDIEVEAAQLALDPAGYGTNNKRKITTSTQKWTHKDSDPAGDLNAGKEAVRRGTGVYPNTLAIGPAVFNALREHPALKERVKYTSRESITAEMLAQLLDVERVVVGRAVYAPDEGDFADVWGNAAVLAYVPAGADGSYAPSGEGAILSREEPSYGYTYVLEGHPMVEQPYQDRNAKSWIYPTTYDAVPVLAGASAGYLIEEPV